ncbi:MAG TPA: ParB/RepB/Spo0J family partition protein [Gemmatimonadaceae bacterium]
MSTKRYDAHAAARRAHAPIADGNPAVANSSTRGQRGPNADAGREYQLVSVWEIDPAPWQPRLIFNDIEALAESISGDDQTEGVGILEPLLVRAKPDGRFELIDGERRWRAAKIVAHGQPGGDYLVPVRMFAVSDRIAQLIGQAANDQRDDHKPLEMALCYRRLREVLEQEKGRPLSVRGVAGIGWHKRSMVSDYLTIGEALTDDVLRDAGVLDATGRADAAIVTKLTVKELLDVAKAAGPEQRVTLLRERADRARGARKSGRVEATPAAPEVSFSDRLHQARHGDGYNIRLRGPVRAMKPEEALRIAHVEVTPALLALVDEGARDGNGYLADVADTHAVLVLPREVEQLTAVQLNRLNEDVRVLSHRVRRALRFRRATPPRATVLAAVRGEAADTG